MKEKVSFIDDLEMVRNDMREIGRKAAEKAKKTDAVSEVRNSNMAYRCMMQAIRDMARQHMLINKISSPEL